MERIDNNGKQDVIIKFTQHSPAKKIFGERRKLSNPVNWKNTLNFAFLWQNSKKNLVSYARNLCAKADENIFIFSDINGNFSISLPKFTEKLWLIF